MEKLCDVLANLNLRESRTTTPEDHSAILLLVQHNMGEGDGDKCSEAFNSLIRQSLIDSAMSPSNMSTMRTTVRGGAGT